MSFAEPERAFINPHLKESLYSSSTKELATAEVPSDVLSQLKANVEEIVEECNSVYSHVPSSDTSVYTGTAGIALLHLHLATTLYVSNHQKRCDHLTKAQTLLRPCLAHLSSRHISFLCGAGGLLAIAAVVEAGLGYNDKAKILIDQLKKLYTEDKERFLQLPSELLFGHVGYLYCLLFVNAYIPEAISNDLIHEIIKVIIDAGKRGREANISCPLMYTWHGKHYLGAAHGMAGITSVLLQVSSSDWHELLTSTVKYLNSLQFPSGNFPSSLESYHGSSHHCDRLVHWCHGAPGFIHMLSHAYQVLGDVKYLSSSKACGDTVWERGLLKKGYCLCHGVAGNAYTFLQLYTLTRHAHHWHRTIKFAEWCLSSTQRLTRTPDTPFSLFEGRGGVAFFYCDVIMMSSRGKSPFPGLEIPEPCITFTL